MDKTVNIFDHFDRVINQLSTQISNRFNVGFFYFSAKQWNDSDFSQRIPVASTSDSVKVSIIINDKDTYLPVSVDGDLACVIKLQNSTHLSGPDLSHISELVDTVVGGSFDLIYKVEALDDRIYQKNHDLEIEESDANNGLPSNVIPISNFSHLKQKRQANSIVDIEESEKEVISDLPIFIQAKSHEQIWRIGHEIYLYTKKQACLQLRDIGMEGQDLTQQFLESLGSVCLIIPEIADLTQESIDVIMEFLLAKRKYDTDGLLLIMGSTHSASDLLNTKKITLNFYRLISQIRLSHTDENLTQDHLATHITCLTRYQSDLQVLTLLSEMGLSAFNVDDLV